MPKDSQLPGNIRLKFWSTTIRRWPTIKSLWTPSWPLAKPAQRWACSTTAPLPGSSSTRRCGCLSTTPAGPPSTAPAAMPVEPGHTGLGTVAALGAKVTDFNVGDRVFGLMDVRETNIRTADQLWPLGDIDPYLALCVEPAYVAFHSVREAQVRYADTVVVVGLGALGLLAVRMARLSGAETLIALDPLPQRRDLALGLWCRSRNRPHPGRPGTGGSQPHRGQRRGHRHRTQRRVPGAANRDPLCAGGRHRLLRPDSTRASRRVCAGARMASQPADHAGAARLWLGASPA